MTRLSTLLDQVDSGTMLLPEFQRGYVWNRDQVRGLMRSLYRGYPVGALLIWETEPSVAAVRGTGQVTSGVKQLLLDGQQRVTTLYGVMRGRPPEFFEGDANAFRGLMFNIETETFEFYAPTKMKGDPLWVDVTELFTRGVDPYIGPLSQDPAHAGRFTTYVTRLLRLQNIRDREFHAEKITGADMTMDHVVDIFNKVNSGGTKLSKGDLALAKMCADWPQARTELRARLGSWQEAGYYFSLDWLLRNVNAVATGKAPFDALDGIDPEAAEAAVVQSTKYIGAFLDLAGGRLGLDHNRVLLGRYAIPVISRIQHLRGGLGDAATQDRLLYWFINAGLWGRFTGSTESVLARDYEIASAEGIDGLITELERWRGGNLRVQPHDFNAFGQGSRFYPMLYLMTRVLEARDLGSGIPLKANLLGHLSSLQVHHIFPKAQLYKHDYSRGQVNSVANFCFLTQNSNLSISSRKPEDYFAEVERNHPGALASQWIPTDPELWTLDRYLDFLEARRRLLADAANSFLDGLRDSTFEGSSEPLAPLAVADSSGDDDESEQVKSLVSELVGMGLAEAQLDVEITDPLTGDVAAIAEAFWEHGLQVGQGEPIVLELDPDPQGEAVMQGLGYRVFNSVESLRHYVLSRSAEASGDDADESEVQVPVAAEAPPVEPSDPKVLLARAMTDIYARAKNEAGYHATIFFRMLSDHGALETARRLLQSPAVSDGYTALYERNRLDLTVENVVLRPEFESLFTDAERDTARRRLQEFGFIPEHGDA